MLWSILIAGIPERYHTAQPLLYSLLETQSVARMNDVELLYLLDNRKRSVGAKRNDLLRAARGEYLSFIDDDDMVAENYVSKIHTAIVEARKQESPIDVICFPQRATLIQERVVHECTYSLDFKERKLEATDQPNVMRWTGRPAHTMCWRRKVAFENGGPFPDKNFCEDVEWVDKACEAAKIEMQLGGDPLYFYNFDSKKTATRG